MDNIRSMTYQPKNNNSIPTRRNVMAADKFILLIYFFIKRFYKKLELCIIDHYTFVREKLFTQKKGRP